VALLAAPESCEQLPPEAVQVRFAVDFGSGRLADFSTIRLKIAAVFWAVNQMVELLPYWLKIKHQKP
jgi:hypothetical protein